jgi:hypothetical protein
MDRRRLAGWIISILVDLSIMWRLGSLSSTRINFRPANAFSNASPDPPLGLFIGHHSPAIYRKPRINRAFDPLASIA